MGELNSCDCLHRLDVKLRVVYNESPEFYQQMLNGEVQVGDLISELSKIAKWQSIQLLVRWISLLAIITSVLGVGFGLCDSLKNILRKWGCIEQLHGILAAIIAVLPAYIIAILITNAFIAVCSPVRS